MKRIAWIFACCLAFTTLFPHPAAQAAPPAPPSPPGHAGLWNRQLDSRRQPALVSSQAAGSVTSSSIYISDHLAFMNPWGKTVYNTYASGNWEIYSGNANLTQVKRLTSNAVPDIEPHFNSGATSVLFLSKRDGDYEIYRMEPNGSGVQQLTNDSADEAYATWSPNGNQIVFSSNRDGNYETYTMNADGSGVTRLTSDPLTDIAPTWSPDGSLIAWVRPQSAGSALGDIWVMKTDGSQQKRIVTGIPLVDNLTWSPDGARLAYSSDAESANGFLETWVVDITSGKFQLVAEGGTYDFIPSGWLPDGDHLAFSTLYYNYNSSTKQWDLWGTQLLVRSLLTGDTFGTNTGLNEMSGSWASTDLTAPVASLALLPAYSPAAGFPLSWSANDSGGSGSSRFEVQISTDGQQSWSIWQGGTKNLSATYTGQPGQTVYFRVSPIDHAWNIGHWTEVQSTRLYSSAISGQVVDNRGQPVSDALITIDPAPWEQAVTGVDGRFNAMLLSSGAHNFQTSHAGFGSLPSSSLSMQQDTSLLQALPPVNNVVMNGAFETGLDGWTAAGPAISAPLKAGQGNAAVRLGLDCPAPCWARSESIAGGDQNSRMVIDSQGGVNVLTKIHSTDGSPVEIDYFYRSPEGDWSGPELLGTATVNNISLAIDGQDTLFALWGDDTFTMKPKGGAWSLPAPIGLWGGAWANLHAGKTGQLYVLYQCNNPVCGKDHPSPSQYASIRDSSSGSWSAPVEIGAYQAASYYNSGTVTSDGYLHAFRIEAGSTSVSWMVKTRTVSPAGELGADTTLDAHISATTRIYVASSENDSIVAAWYNNYATYYTRLQPGGIWSTPATIAGVEGLYGLASGPANSFHFFAYPPFGFRKQPGLYYSMNAAGVMHGPTQVVQTDLLQAAFDPSGWMHVVQSSAATGLTYWQGLTYLPGTEISLSQEVSIPADMYQPTLAFLYKTSGNYTGARFRFSIVAGGVTTEVMAVTQASGEWKHAWMDLSPWSAQTIQVRAVLEHPENGPLAAAYLDDVSLGSWVTPVIQSITPNSIGSLMNGPVEVLISGENFDHPVEVRLGEKSYLPEQVEPGVLRIIIQPGDLTPGYKDVVVLNQSGVSGCLPAGFLLASPLYFPLLVGG